MKLGLVLGLLGWGIGVGALAQPTLKPVAPKFAPDPQIYTGRAVGMSAASELAPVVPTSGRAVTCPLPSNVTPNHILTIEKPMSVLSLRVFAPNPLILTVKGREGITCKSGINPEIMGAWSEGKYQIWVHSVNGETVNYRLSLSETSQPEPSRNNPANK
ncbi:MAG: hypothetical protein ACK4QL_07900 [Pseudanabaenaceae cyanobacterium]